MTARMQRLRNRPWIKAAGLALVPVLAVMYLIARYAGYPFPFPVVILLFAVGVSVSFGGRLAAIVSPAAYMAFAVWYVLYPTNQVVLDRDAGVLIVAFVVAGPCLAFLIRISQQGTEREIAGRMEVQVAKAALAAERERAVLLDTILSALDEIVILTDTDGTIISASPAARETLGYGPLALAGRNLAELVPNPFAPAGERTARHHDGHGIEIDFIMKPIADPSRGAFIAVIRDITQRKQNERDLRRWADAFQQAAFGIAITDAADNEIVVANPAYAALHGVDPDDLTGVNPVSLYAVEERPRVIELKQNADRRRHIMFEAMRMRADGSTFPAQMSITTVRDDTGVVRYRITSAIDIGGYRDIEKQLVQAQKLEAIGNLTGGMAHDFNNLLGIIMLNLDSLEPLVDGNPIARELVTDCIAAADAGADLTARLLAFARRQPLNPVSLAVNDLIAGVVTLLRRTLGENVAITLDLAEDAWLVYADPANLEASILNLATNARDAMPRGGRLVISTRNHHRGPEAQDSPGALVGTAAGALEPGDYVRIEVSDTGVGMPSAVRDRIFEPFFTTKEHGQGLGLSMVFGFVKQSGGHVTVDTALGRGTTIQIYLPRSPGAEPAAAPAPADAALRGNGEIILVVEDNALLRRSIVRQVLDLGYRAREADGAEAALMLLARERMDLLLSDVVMPGETDGLRLARTVLDVWPGMRVLLMSGYHTPDLNEAGAPLPASIRILNKPYHQDVLARYLREALDR